MTRSKTDEVNWTYTYGATSFKFRSRPGSYATLQRHNRYSTHVTIFFGLVLILAFIRLGLELTILAFVAGICAGLILATIMPVEVAAEPGSITFKYKAFGIYRRQKRFSSDVISDVRARAYSMGVFSNTQSYHAAIKLDFVDGSSKTIYDGLSVNLVEARSNAVNSARAIAETIGVPTEIEEE